MTGDPPEGVDPPTLPTMAGPGGDTDPRAIHLTPGDGVVLGPSTERLPEMERPPEIQRFLSPLPPRPSEPPPSSSGGTRRRSRRTVKVPVEPSAVTAQPATMPGSQLIDPRKVPTMPAVPRPAPRASATVKVPDGSARAEATPPPAAPPPPPAPPPLVAAPAPEEVMETIQPMRIISIEAAPSTIPPPPAPPPELAPSPPESSSPPPPVAAAPAPSSEEVSSGRVSRPPLLASPELEAFAPSPPPVPRPAKPPPPAPEVEVEEVEDVDEPITDASPPPVEAEAAVNGASAHGHRADEVEPIALDEVEDRISDSDVAFSAAIEPPVDSGGATPRPKKPPPPPPKRAPVSDGQPSPSLTTPPPTSVRGGDLANGVPIAAASPPPPPAAPPPPPAAPPPPPVSAAPQSAPSSVPTLDLAGRKRQKPWWEELFGDDYLRTMEKVEPKTIRKECDFIEDRLGLEKGAVMLDLACGSGYHAVELASRGYNVVGYDLSLPMLARAQDEAQERGQKINFLQGDMREMAFEEAFDGIFSWSTSFGYFDDEKNVNVLSRVHRGLRQGGLFLLDVVNRDYVCPRQPSLVWFEGDGCVCMDEMHVDFFTSRLRVKRTVMFEDGRSRECDYGIRLYGLHELGKMLHDTGFKVVEVTGHPAHPGVFFGSESPRIIILAERG